MTTSRSIQVLTTGLIAAHDRMFSDKGLRRPEYPRDFTRLYDWSEDGLFRLFCSIKDKKPAEAREAAADIIVLMSEIIEYAERVEEFSVPNTEPGG